MNKKETRKTRAKEREAAKRNPEAQLKHLDNKGFTATKERQKLAEKIWCETGKKPA